MGVKYSDIEQALHSADKLSDVTDAFKHVQEVTSCSTGCGGCYNSILEIISELLHR
ncbi:MAG: (2Fe-2S)-binding protein [Ruminococcus sp.]|nr:(2Fe-2S)-binding protein [Ruminococcus sp.]